MPKFSSQDAHTLSPNIGSLHVNSNTHEQILTNTRLSLDTQSKSRNTSQEVKLILTQTWVVQIDQGECRSSKSSKVCKNSLPRALFIGFDTS